MCRGSDKILQLHCTPNRWREGTPTADASKSDKTGSATLKVYSQNYLLWCSDRQQELCTSKISFQRTRKEVGNISVTCVTMPGKLIILCKWWHIKQKNKKTKKTYQEDFATCNFYFSVLWLCYKKWVVKCDYVLQQVQTLSCCNSLNAPINVKPAGGEAGHGVGSFDIFQKFAVKSPAHGQIIPVKCNFLKFPHPGLHIAIKYPKAEPQKGTMKISPNITLQSLLINVAASPKIHVSVRAAIIRFNHNPCYTV